MKNHLKALWAATSFVVIYFSVVIAVFILAYVICIFTECPKHQTFGEYYAWILLVVIYFGIISVFLSYMIYDVVKDIVKKYKEELKKLKNENGKLIHLLCDNGINCNPIGYSRTLE